MPLKLGTKSIFGQTKEEVIKKQKNIIGSHRDGFQVSFQPGKGVNCTLSPLTLSAQTFEGKGNLKGYELTIQIFNATAAQQTHNWQLTNDTQSTTISSDTNVVLEDGAYIILTFLVPPEIITPGDLLKFRISKGTVGTDDTEIYHGYVSFFVNSLEETDELN